MQCEQDHPAFIKACLDWSEAFQSQCKLFGVVITGASPPEASIMASH
jgi:hypothetical protein